MLSVKSLIFVFEFFKTFIVFNYFKTTYIIRKVLNPPTLYSNLTAKFRLSLPIIHFGATKKEVSNKLRMTLYELYSEVTVTEQEQESLQNKSYYEVGEEALFSYSNLPDILDTPPCLPEKCFNVSIIKREYYLKTYSKITLINRPDLRKMYSGKDVNKKLSLPKIYSGMIVNNALFILKRFSDKNVRDQQNISKIYSNITLKGIVSLPKVYYSNETTQDKQFLLKVYTKAAIIDKLSMLNTYSKVNEKERLSIPKMYFEEKRSLTITYPEEKLKEKLSLLNTYFDETLKEQPSSPNTRIKKKLLKLNKYYLVAVKKALSLLKAISYMSVKKSKTVEEKLPLPNIYSEVTVKEKLAVPNTNSEINKPESLKLNLQQNKIYKPILPILDEADETTTIEINSSQGQVEFVSTVGLLSKEQSEEVLEKDRDVKPILRKNNETLPKVIIFIFIVFNFDSHEKIGKVGLLYSSVEYNSLMNVLSLYSVIQYCAYEKKDSVWRRSVTLQFFILYQILYCC